MIYISVFLERHLVKLYTVTEVDSQTFKWTRIGSYQTVALAEEAALKYLREDHDEGHYMHYREGSISGFPEHPSEKFCTGPVGL